MNIDYETLITAAYSAREYAYAPYSGFLVGAALLDTAGQIHTGCNVENAAYGPTNCAERTAIFKAVSMGVRNFRAIAIVGAGNTSVFPCGVCRQVLAEFCDLSDFQIVIASSITEYRVFSLNDLLPFSFTPNDLNM
ncbi:MAG: cytidine deaminase [Lachnospiraceae bacterium]